MTTDIELALVKGKIVGARKLLQEEFLKQDKAEFEAKLRAEYDELYPVYREMTENEELEYDKEVFSVDEVMPDAYGYGEDFEYPKVEIDYSQDENYKTFEEYKNETRVVQEASYVCDECQLALEDDKCINNIEHTTRLIQEVTELVRPYIAKDVTDKVDAYIKSRYAELRKNEYPAIEEFADAWVKNDTDGMELYRSKCLAVKEKYPKGL